MKLSRFQKVVLVAVPVALLGLAVGARSVQDYQLTLGRPTILRGPKPLRLIDCIAFRATLDYRLRLPAPLRRPNFYPQGHLQLLKADLKDSNHRLIPMTQGLGPFVAPNPSFLASVGDNDLKALRDVLLLLPSYSTYDFSRGGKLAVTLGLQTTTPLTTYWKATRIVEVPPEPTESP